MEPKLTVIKDDLVAINRRQFASTIQNYKEKVKSLEKELEEEKEKNSKNLQDKSQIEEKCEQKIKDINKKTASKSADNKILSRNLEKVIKESAEQQKSSRSQIKSLTEELENLRETSNSKEKSLKRKIQFLLKERKSAGTRSSRRRRSAEELEKDVEMSGDLSPEDHQDLIDPIQEIKSHSNRMNSKQKELTANLLTHLGKIRKSKAEALKKSGWLVGKNRKLSSQLAKFQKKVATLNEKIIKLLTEAKKRDDLLKEKMIEEKKMRDAISNLDGLKIELAFQLKEQKTADRRIIQKLEGDLEYSRQIATSLQSEKEEIQKKAISLKTANAQLNGGLQKCRNKINQMRFQAIEDLETIQRLRNELNDRKEQIDEKDDKINLLETINTRLECLKNETEEKIRGVEQQALDYLSQLQEIRILFEEDQSKIAHLEMKNSQLNGELRESKFELKNARNEAEKRLQEMEQNQKEIRILFEQSQAKSEDLETKNSQLGGELRESTIELKRNKEKSQRQINALEQLAETYFSQIEEMRILLDQNQAKINGEKRRVVCLKRELHKSATQLKAMRKGLAGREETIKRIRAISKIRKNRLTIQITQLRKKAKRNQQKSLSFPSGSSGLPSGQSLAGIFSAPLPLQPSQLSHAALTTHQPAGPFRIPTILYPQPHQPSVTSFNPQLIPMLQNFNPNIWQQLMTGNTAPPNQYFGNLLPRVPNRPFGQ